MSYREQREILSAHLKQLAEKKSEIDGSRTYHNDQLMDINTRLATLGDQEKALRETIDVLEMLDNAGMTMKKPPIADPHLVSECGPSCAEDPSVHRHPQLGVFISRQHESQG